MRFLLTKRFSIFLFFSIGILFSCSEDDSVMETSVTAENFSVTMDENPTSGQVIGVVQGSTNQGSVSFYVTDQIPSGAFSIDISSGELRVEDVSVYNFELNPIITGLVKVENGTVSEEVSVTINLIDIDEIRVYEGDVHLRTQREVVDFGANLYTQINGTLRLGGEEIYSDIYDLSPLIDLETINGYLHIQYTHDLITTAGIENLSHVNGLSIYWNKELKKIEGLQNITHISEFLNLEFNYELDNIEGLSQLSSVGTNLGISDNFKLATLDPLNNLTAVGGSIGIANNSILENLDGLSNLKDIGNDITILDNYLLENVDGFENLNPVNMTSLWISRNASLKNIDGLHNIKVLERVRIENNPQLLNVNGLSRISGSLISIILTGNLALGNLDAFSELTEATSSLTISGSAGLTNLSGLNSLMYVSTLSIKSNYYLTDFCDIRNFLTIGSVEDYVVQENAYNPTEQDIIDGNCSI